MPPTHRLKQPSVISEPADPSATLARSDAAARVPARFDVARRVIEKAARHTEGGNGVATIAALLNLTESAVYKFTYPKARSGTDGLIPSDHVQTLLAKGPPAGIPFTPEDFADSSVLPEGDREDAA